MLNRIKQAQKERGCTNKELADVTSTSESTVCRYLKGESDAPFDFVAKAAKHLEISLDEMTGNPAGKKNTKDELYEHIKELYESRLEGKRERIAALEAEKKDMRERMDKKNKMIVRLFLALAVVLSMSLYFVVDAYNGDWGLVRYEKSLMELLPDYAERPTEYDVPHADDGDDVVGLWVK